ncbi:MAG TPA: hypothetical protein VE035_14665, partial [Puia sp.]|nr:hypothetical protein [Puia sp.]
AVSPLTLSYSSYAGQVGRLWNGYEKPAIIGESGWDHTFYEPGMPGYLALFHNALWASLGAGAAMTPFWWAYSTRLNEVLVSPQMTNIRKYTDQIPFARLSHLSKADISVSKGDAYAIRGDEMIFGWVVNAQTDVAGKTVRINGAGSGAGANNGGPAGKGGMLKAGKYKLRLYHTWRGQFLDTTEVSSSNGSISFTIPALHMTDHTNYVGQDIAFILEPAGP